MNQSLQVKKLASALRQSRRALPYQAIVALIFLGMIWGVHLWWRFPDWIAWLASVLAVFSTVSDAINIVYCRRALRRLGGTIEDA
jgi:hypothetical protein